MTERLKALVYQAVKFGAVGVVNSLIDWGAFALLTMIPFMDAHYPVAKALSFSLGMANSFVMNTYFTFGEKPTRKKAALFVLVNLVSLGVSIGALTLCVEVVGLPKSIGNLVSIGCSMAVGFTLNKLLVFKGLNRV